MRYKKAKNCDIRTPPAKKSKNLAIEMKGLENED
jgi:hypothetical protein